MKIVLLTIGTLGDIRPYTALGYGLRQAGYDVYHATHDCFSGFVTSHGLKFRHIAGDPAGWAAGEELGRLTASGRDFLGWMRRLRQLTAPLMADILDSGWQACQGAEAVIYSPLAWAGYSIAEKLDIPGFLACLQPMTATGDFPAVWAPRLRLGKPYNRASHYLVEQVYWQVNRPFINRWRGETLGLPPLPLTGPYRQERWRRQPCLCGYSREVVPPPRDWPASVHVTGFWYLPDDRLWQPDQKLADFLAAGPPPIYLGFGSMPDPRPSELLRVILEALRATGLRAVVQGQFCAAANLPENVYQVDWAPHRWLFPQMAAVAHHGGASTLANGLWSCKPSVIISYAWDQPFWGQRVVRLGAGPAPIPRQRLTTEKLISAINQAVGDRKIRAAAAELGHRLRAEDGVAEAVRVIQAALGSSR